VGGSFGGGRFMMGRGCWGFAVLALLPAGGEGLLPEPEPPADLSVTGPEPDPRKAGQVGLCPTDADLARLRSVEGRPRGVVLRTLGHPVRVAVRADGSEVWRYPWVAVCEVYVRGGRCTGTFYCGGY
jgi:hypothetical protein